MGRGFYLCTLLVVAMQNIVHSQPRQNWCSSCDIYIKHSALFTDNCVVAVLRAKEKKESLRWCLRKSKIKSKVVLSTPHDIRKLKKKLRLRKSCFFVVSKRKKGVCTGDLKCAAGHSQTAEEMQIVNVRLFCGLRKGKVGGCKGHHG